MCTESKCRNINYNSSSDIFEFEASSFSTFAVGDIRTCSEQSGFICSISEICKGSWIITSDTNSCCSTACTQKPFEFDDAPQCSNKLDLIDITIKNPDNSDDFEVGWA